MNKLTFDEVIEEHRKLTNSIRVGITLGPQATPESLREALAQERAKMDELNAYPMELRLRGELEQLHKLLSRISKLGTTDIKDIGKEPPEVCALKLEIFRATDIISVDVEELIAYCKLRHDGYPAKARKLYQQYINNHPTVHTNRFASWHELDNARKQFWSDRVQISEDPKHWYAVDK